MWMRAWTVFVGRMKSDRAKKEAAALAERNAAIGDIPAHIPEDQSLVLDDQSPFADLMRPFRYKIYYGGRGAAKTRSFAEALIRKAAGQRLRILCTRQYQNSIKDSVYRVLVDTIERLALKDYFDVTASSIKSKVGSEFIFKGLKKDVGEIKSTEGIDICWVAEAQYVADDAWEILIPTIRGDTSEIWIEFNVEDEEAPTHKRFVTQDPSEAGSFCRHFVNYDANPYFPAVLRREMEALKINDEDAYQHVWRGRAKKLSDDVIFRGKYVVEDFPDDLWMKADEGRLFFGADFGFAQDPATLMRFFIHKRRLYIEYEAWGIGVDLEGNVGPDGRGEMEQLYDSVPGSRGVPGAPVSWPIKADSARPEVISFLKGRGYAISAAEKWTGCVEDGIAHMRSFEKIVIHPRCKHMEEEAKLYKYKKDPKTGDVLPIIIDKHNHCWDAIRYGLDGYIQRGGIAIWELLAKRRR